MALRKSLFAKTDETTKKAETTTTGGTRKPFFAEQPKTESVVPAKEAEVATKSNKNVFTKKEKPYQVPAEKYPSSKIETKKTAAELFTPTAKPYSIENAQAPNAYSKIQDQALKTYNSLTYNDIKKMKSSELVDLRIKAGLDKGDSQDWSSSFMAGVGDLMSTIGTATNLIDQKGGVIAQAGNKLKEAGEITKSTKTDYEALANMGEFDWGDLKNPDFWSNKVPRMVPFTLSLVPLSIVGGEVGAGIATKVGLGALGQAIVGSVAGAAASRPAESLMEAANAFDTAKEKGMSDEESRKVAGEVFTENLKQLSALDVIQMIPFIKNIKGLNFASNPTVDKILNAGSIAVGVGSEGVEEVLQNRIVDMAMGDKFDMLSPDNKESFILGIISGGIFQGIGSVQQVVVSNLAPKEQNEYQQYYNKFLSEERSNTDAMSLALNEVGKTNPTELKTAVDKTVNDEAKKIQLDSDMDTVREKIKTGQEVIQTKYDPDLVKEVSDLQTKLNNYEDSIKKETIIVKETADSPATKIETVQYPNGKYAIKLNADLSSNSIMTDFTSSKLYLTEDMAIKGAKKELLAWAEDTIKKEDIAPQDKIALTQIIYNIKNPEIQTVSFEPKVGDVVSFNQLENGEKTGVENKTYTVKEVVELGTKKKPITKYLLVDENGKEIYTTKESIEYVGKKFISPKEKIVDQKKITSLEEELRNKYLESGADKIEEEMGKIFFELDLAEKGERFMTEDGEWIGKNSSFPSWIPEELRSKKLFDKVIKNLYDINELTFPNKNKSKQRELYNLILDELDSRLGVDTSELRSQIINEYGRIKEEENTGDNGEITGGGEKRRISQKEKVIEAVKKKPKTIKEISEETNILEPNVRRILGMGAKEGTFERIDKGVYVLSKDGQDIAWVETGNAVESLPRLAKEGFKADMVFLDIPYDTPAVKGGNRGVKYSLLSVEDFGKVLDAVSEIAKTENSPIIHMYSQAESGLKAMAKYNDLFIEKGFKPAGKGQYQKTFADGSPVTSPNGKVSRPEGILVFTKSGNLDKELGNLNFTLKRPKGYQTEKPAEMLKSMIEMTTEEGDMVLDPFAGSGVTGAEAIRAGRKAYLIERDLEVAKKITKSRVKEAIEEKENNIQKSIEAIKVYEKTISNPDSTVQEVAFAERGIEGETSYLKGKINEEIVNLDASIDKIRKLNPKNKDDARDIQSGLTYEIEFSYPESLGEMGNQTSFWLDSDPTVKNISDGIIETYQEEIQSINEPMVAGIVAKSGRDENIEKALNVVLKNQEETIPEEMGMESPIKEVNKYKNAEELKNIKQLSRGNDENRFEATIGKDGYLEWTVSDNKKGLFLEAINVGKETGKGIGVNSIKALFNKYPKVKSIEAFSSTPEASVFFKKIGATQDTGEPINIRNPNSITIKKSRLADIWNKAKTPIKKNVLPSTKKKSFKEKVEIKDETAAFAHKWSVRMPLEAETKETINKTSIMTWLEKTFNVPIRSKVTHKWKASGMYYTKKWLVRLAKWGELPVAVHEVAHHLDMSVLPKGWRKNYEFQTELANLDYDQSKRRTSEGFAEYLRYKMTTEEAPLRAPKFDKFFEDFLNKNPTLQKQLTELKKKLTIWFTQGAENRTIQHIDWKGEHTKIFGVKHKINKAVSFVQEKFNDEFYVPQKITSNIEDVLKRKLRPTMNPAKMMEFSKAKAGAIAKTFVSNSAIDEAGNPVGKSLREVLSPIKRSEIKQFIAYAVSKRAVNLEKRGIESGFDIDDSQFIIDKYKDKGWDEVVDGLTEWSNHLLDWIINAGGLEGKAAARMRELNPIYVPFKRAFLDELQVVKGGGGYVDTGSGVKSIKGSGRAIFNPIEAMIAQATPMIAKAQKIRIASIFTKLAEENNLGGYITEVPAPMTGTKFDASQIADYIAKVTGEEVGDLSGDMLTVFTQGSRYTGKENVVTSFKDGKLKFYEIHPDLYNAFKAIDPLKLGPVAKVFSSFSQLLRLGATGLKVSFGLVRNPFRDALSYVVFAKNKKATPFDPFFGLYKDLTTKKGQPTWRFKALGGALSGQIGLDRAATRNVYDEMLLENLGKKGKALLIVKHPLDALRDILSITEMGPRSIELENNYKKYLSEDWKKTHPDWTEEDAFVQAFLDAQDVTVNFTKSGKWSRQLNEITAFFNVAIRGPEKMVRTFKERPVEITIKSIMWLTMIALASWYQNKDKDWYKNLEPAYKYNNLFFEVGNNVYRLPIPFELGTIFMAIPQAVLDNNSESFEGIMSILKSQIPDPTPSIFGPALDVASNKNYLGSPIESEGMKYKYVTERYKDYTSGLAKSLSKILDKGGIALSPVQIDYLIEGYSGGFLKQFRVSGGEVYDLPVLSDVMLRDPLYPKRQLNNFFTDYSKLGSKVSSEIATLEEQNKYDDIKSFYDAYKDIQLDIVDAKAAKNTEKVNTLYKEITETLKSYGYN